MPKMWLLVVFVVVSIFVGIFAVGWSQGVPSTPTASTTVVIAPGSSQSVPVTFTFQLYSLQAPNSIWQIGTKVIYSATESNSLGSTTVLAQNASATTSVQSNNGLLYTMFSTQTFSTTAICSGACTGYVMNITITAHAQVTTPLTVWTSPTVKIVLSSIAAYNLVPASPAPSPNGMYLELFVPITAVAAADFFVAYAVVVKHPVLVWSGGIAIVLVLLEYFVIW